VDQDPSDAVVPVRVSVVICAYTEDRWPMLSDAVASIENQTYKVEQIIICIDHNESLVGRCEASRKEWEQNGSTPITVLSNKFNGRLGSARNTAIEIADCDVVAFLDDDARADEHWLGHLVDPYRHEDVIAVGGAPLPDFESERPFWFPPQLDWVFGCYYDGLPRSLEPTDRLIGAAMSARLEALKKIGGFHSDNHDDMDMCHRLKHNWPDHKILFEPRAIVHHRVTKERVTWSYLWRRCFFVNMGKVEAFKNMGEAASMNADRRFVLDALLKSVRIALEDVRRFRLQGLVQTVVLFFAVVCAALGHLAGQVKVRWAS